MKLNKFKDKDISFVSIEKKFGTNEINEATNLLKIRLKNAKSKKISMIKSDCKFLSVKGTKPSLINVKKVTIPIKIHKNEDKIIQLKFLIILNIFNKH